jgi:hypothetical protein
MSIIQNKNKSISSSLSIKNQIKEEENHNNSAKLSQYSDKNIEFNNKIEFDFNLKPENSIHVSLSTFTGEAEQRVSRVT